MELDSSTNSRSGDGKRGRSSEILQRHGKEGGGDLWNRPPASGRSRVRSAGKELLSAVCSTGLLLWSFTKRAGRLSLRLWDVGKNI